MELWARRWKRTEANLLERLQRDGAGPAEIAKRLRVPVHQVGDLLEMGLAYSQRDGAVRGRCTRCRISVRMPCVSCGAEVSLRRRNQLPPDLPEKLRQALETPIAELGLDDRTIGALEAVGLIYVHDLVLLSLEELQRTPGVGQITIDKLFRELAKLGLCRTSQGGSRG